MKLQIVAILAHFWPVFGLLWPWYQCLKLSMSVFFLVMTGWSEIGKKNLNNNDFLSENADFSHFSPFLAWFWPDMAPVSVSKALNENICSRYDWIELYWQKNSNNNDFSDEIADFDHFNPILACFWPVMAPVSISKALNEYSWPNCDRIEWDNRKNSK